MKVKFNVLLVQQVGSHLFPFVFTPLVFRPGIDPLAALALFNKVSLTDFDARLLKTHRFEGAKPDAICLNAPPTPSQRATATTSADRQTL